MKAYFDKDGCLVVSAENGTEAVALEYWRHRYDDVDNQSLRVNEACAVLLIDPVEYLKI